MISILWRKTFIIQPPWQQTFCDFFFFSPIAHQVKPETPTFGGGEQGASKARDDHVLSHCSFLAHQHLGVVATLEPAFYFCHYHDRRTHCPSFLCVKCLATRCTRALCEEDLDACVQGLLTHRADIFWFCLFNTCTVLFFYSSLILFSHTLFLLETLSLNAKHDLL